MKSTFLTFAKKMWVFLNAKIVEGLHAFTLADLSEKELLESFVSSETLAEKVVA
jgi:hypothetical protein